MNIGIIGANGKAGQLIMEEALQRGQNVTAIVRDAKKVTNPEVEVLEKDLFDLTTEDLSKFDAVIDAFGAWGDQVSLHVTSLKHLTDQLGGTGVRLLIVGGAGSLYTNKEHTIQVKDAKDFPAAFLPLASAMAEGLAELRKVNNVHWTYISPAADFAADAPATGKYILSGEEFTTNSKGESKISYADYAIAMIDEVLSGKHDHSRISVIGE